MAHSQPATTESCNAKSGCWSVLRTGHTGYHRGTEPQLTEDRSPGGGWRGEVGPASTPPVPDPALCLYRTIFCVTSILISRQWPRLCVRPSPNIFLPIFVITSWYLPKSTKVYTREEVAKLAMAAANLLVSCPLDFKVGTFSMKYKI